MAFIKNDGEYINTDHIVSITGDAYEGGDTAINMSNGDMIRCKSTPEMLLEIIAINKKFCDVEVE